VADSWLHEAGCRQRPELWPKVGYMKLCVDRGKTSSGELYSHTSCVPGTLITVLTATVTCSHCGKLKNYTIPVIIPFNTVGQSWRGDLIDGH
jgi:hypothetical protein